MLLFVMYTKLEQTGLSWFELAKVDTDVILRCEHNVLVTKLHADASAGTWKLHCYWDIVRFYQILVISLWSDAEVTHLLKKG